MKNHPWAWLIWFSAAVVLSLSTRNPLYALILIGVARLAGELHGRQDPMIGLSFGRMAAVILLFSTIYAALFIHIGDHVIYSLPDWPLIGGAITLEAIADGLRNGIILLTLITIFLAFNAIIPVSVLVRLIPASLKDIGVVLLVAITYVPETRHQLRRIREAQAIRGHEVRGLRDWRPVIVPLLVAGFERSLRLSETMVARGYGSTTRTEHKLWKRGGLLSVTGIALTGWLILWAGFQLGWLLIILAISLLALLILLNPSQIKRTRYHRYEWSTQDWLLIATALLALAAATLPIPFIDKASLSYLPYPTLSFPDFDIFIGMALALMAIPAIMSSNLAAPPVSNDKDR